MSEFRSAGFWGFGVRVWGEGELWGEGFGVRIRGVGEGEGLWVRGYG